MVTNSWMAQHAQREQRATIGGSRRQSADDFIQFITGGSALSASDILVTIETAMGVPAVWAAVNFLSGTLAGLPLKVYRKTKQGRETVRGPLADMLHYAVNDECSSFEWRKLFFDCAFTTGRGLSYIERSASGTPVAIWHMEPEKTTIERRSGRKFYVYQIEAGRTVTYAAADVIDVPFSLKADGLEHRSPINTGRDAIGLAIAITQYGSKFFANGGVPPFAITGNFTTPDGLRRASDDMQEAVKKSAKEKRQAITLPLGLDIKPIGGNPEQNQLVEVQRFCIEQIARLYSLPPIFLQDLTNGTFSNNEQQDLHFVKHTLKRWAEAFEQELNLKLFGRTSNTRYVELEMDGLLRGDFKTRIEGYARGIQTGLFMPAEARERENLPYVEGSDQLFMQGATVPINRAGEQPPAEAPAPTDTDEPDDQTDDQGDESDDDQPA